ncbi:MAG TPA: hypothetical protein VM938_15665 [Acidimicrobiales bacterium]|nr:hypothetical protein [Acidimicrobiales bacterium]
MNTHGAGVVRTDDADAEATSVTTPTRAAVVTGDAGGWAAALFAVQPSMPPATTR